ncbi:hypothetical protein RHM65_14030 [Pseudomonas sp. CCI4.2]|uniref:dermonecrotic toxin domain-containing protein n=1 Tax=Pseudomonas sp. CCI4.2 TaxID=3048620 RepID=UPI002AC913FC|nr:DUF6543 domain-containing protein [Pseudomonas sp. CCI4.2]MEB0090261.1 hypothetical protein [Pseudomonas sp. CCI4.2]WPX51969.1 hypothetical protein RHM65_14030 [Pseudomonas sp. CCI4.2]
MLLDSISTAAPSVSLPYFHAESLKQRFTQNVENALLAEHIDEAEALWLRTLVTPPSDTQDWNPPRLDGLKKNGGLPANVELAAALQISYRSSDTTIFLDTLLYGLERFDDREQLLGTLLQRFGSRTEEVPTFEDVLIETPVFENRMFNIIDHHVEKIEALAQHLEQIPSLQMVFQCGLQQTLAGSLPGLAGDPSSHLLQILESPESPKVDGLVSGTQSLLDAALDDYSGIALPLGRERRFIDSFGKTLDQVGVKSVQLALSNTIKAVPATFETQLGKFWWSPVGQGQTRREYVANAFAEAFRQHLYARRHDGFLVAHESRRISTLLDPQLKQWGDGGPITVMTLALSDNARQRPRLVGVFVIASVVPSLPELIVYTAGKGLRRFRNRLELSDHFSTPEGTLELLCHLPLSDHAWVTSTPWTLQFDDMEGNDPFLNAVDSIMALQNSNVQFALQQPRPERSRIAVMIDDALDVRYLVDQRLICLGARHRWREGIATFDETWLKSAATGIPATAASGKGKGETVPRSPTWTELTQILEDNAQRMWEAQPDVERCSLDALNRQLAVIGEGHLTAKEVRVQIPEQLPAKTQGTLDPAPQSVDLVTLLLERASGYRQIEVPADSQISILTAPQQVNVLRLTPQLLNHVLNSARAQLSAALMNQTQQFYTRPLRRNDSQLFPGAISRGIRNALLRIELDLASRLSTFNVQAREAFEQVLNYPTRNLRRVFGDKAVEVYSLWLTYDPSSSAVQMTNVFALQQPGRTDSTLLFWTPFEGLKVVESLDILQQAIIARLRNGERREHWLALFAEPDKARIRKCLERTEAISLSIQTRQIDGNFIEYLQTVDLNRRTQGVVQAFEWASRCRVEAKLFGNLVAAAQADDSTALALDVISSKIQNVLFEARIPAWMKAASAESVEEYADVLRRYAQITLWEKDFLFGIPGLKGFAREQVIKQLHLDFPDHPFDPDDLQITLTRYVGSPTGLGQTPSFFPAATDIKTQTLTEFALNHSAAIQGATLTVASGKGRTVPAQLTPAYLKGLIRTLDVGAHFQKLLTQKLDTKGPEYAIRKGLFVKQWPAMMIELAMQKKLEGPLTSNAYQYIEGLMEMPDTLARQAVHGEEIVLCPLRLIAQDGAIADTVPGFYVICSKDAAKGPVILYSIFNRNFCFKEYVTRESLLQDIRRSSALQSQLMQRVSDEVRTRYGHHSFHLPPLWSVDFYVDYPMFSLGPVTLSYEPIPGNLLTYLFEDTLNVLKQMAQQQTVTTAQADWESFTYLMTLGAEQMLIFMPGELGVLIAAWQGVLMLQSSAESAVGSNWGRALGEFTVALSIFAMAKQSAAETSNFEPVVPIRLSKLMSRPEYSWQNTQLPSEVKRRLQTFEVSDITLGNLLKDELYNLYQAPLTQKNYAAVAGKVYEVRRENERWNIISGDKVGPNLRLNQHQQWELNVHWGLKGGGGAVTRLSSAAELAVGDVEHAINLEFSVLATGMPQIRQLYRARARQIGRAHLQAKRYIETCMDNLNALESGGLLHPKVNQIITAFFGIQNTSAELLGSIRQSVTGLFNSVMDPSLASYSSPRYVIGLNRAGYETTVAFTLKEDPLLRIFLTERFFQSSFYHLKVPLAGSASFNATAHARSASVIHEVSHLSNNTFDIAYVESSAPFLDLMADDSPGMVQLKSDVEEMQLRFLSHRTPIEQLFKRFKNGRWEDLSDDPAEGKSFVLGVTGKSTLAEARLEFLANAEMRGEILLNNADSLTLLVMLLGRHNFVP